MLASRFAVLVFTTGAAACSADPGPDLKGTEAPDTSTPVDTAVPFDTGPADDSTVSFDTALSPDTSAPDTSAPDTSALLDAPGLDSLGFDTTAPDSGTDSTMVDSPTDGTGVDTADAGTSCPTCALQLLYKTSSVASPSNEMKPWVKIVNTSSSPQPLSEITVRYWFTINGDHALIHFCDYAAIGCGNVVGAYTKLATTRTGADYYYELSFTAGAGNIPAGGDSGEIQNRLHKSDFSTWTQSDDYSFDATKSGYALWDHVTVYRAGVLVYGTEP